MSNPGSPPAGWFPVPGRPDAEGYWNGSAWTGQMRAAGVAAVPPLHPDPAIEEDDEGNRSYLITALLAWLLGGLGVDRFYLGKIGTAIVKLVTLGGLGVWTAIDLWLVLTGVARDRDGLRLRGYRYRRRVVLPVIGGLWALGTFAVVWSLSHPYDTGYLAGSIAYALHLR